MLPSLPALRAFDAAARLGSFRAAAETLSVSSTAVSHHIRGLEDALQVILFHRSGRKVSLTEDGRRLAKATGQAFALLEEAVDSFQKGAQHVVRVAAGPIITARWLMPRISDFWEAHPGVELEFLPMHRPGSIGGTQADIVIRWERLQDMPEGGVKLIELQPVAVASPGFISRHGPFTTAQDLLSVPILHQRNHWGWLDWFAAQGTKVAQPLRGAIFEDANILTRGAAEGQGAIIGWLPLVAQDLAEGRIARLFDEDITPTHGYVMETPGGPVLPKAVQTVRDWLASSPAG
jgi:LysR family glycine cleavage system transcriptional activator